MTFVIVKLDPMDVQVGDILITCAPAWTEEDVINTLGQDIFDALRVAGEAVDEDWAGAALAIMTRDVEYHIHGTVTVAPHYIDNETKGMVKILCDDPMLISGNGEELEELSTCKMLYNVGEDYAYVLRLTGYSCVNMHPQQNAYESMIQALPPAAFRQLYEGRFLTSEKRNAHGKFTPPSTGKSEE